jgi:hypothetical protein
MFASCLDDTLLAFEKPRMLKRLVIADHRLIFEEQVSDFLVH